jgi:hypothetical protein
MASNIVNQNKALSDAGKTPRDTSHRDRAAQSYSAKVTSTRPASVQAESQADGQMQIRSSGNTIKGSYEGLNHSSPTVLQFNDTGYDDKSNQGARFNKNFASHASGSVSASTFTNSKNSGIMDNYSSVTTKDSSSDRLSGIVNNNMMFR